MRKTYLSPELVQYLDNRATKARRDYLRAKESEGVAERFMALFGPRSGTPDALLSSIISRNMGRARAELKAAEKYQRCGALTRRGKICQCRPEPGMDRCKLHGGKSTGPRTEAGREAIRESNRRRAEARRLLALPS